ncbi:tyrosine-protein kinase SYK-like isoform X3 [Apostichopus japonicus]|uniref:tyrosine-protein kinase SYK-like isoform X3 n=1 Tax=Stichopus japonicus TaxID=307972 RepID=UPI003AB72A1C
MSGTPRRSLPSDPLNFRYYHGRITREDAEQRLRDLDCIPGSYLLRESLAKEGNYALSLCYGGIIYHYAIERQHDGFVAIKDGKKFIGAIELVLHHEQHEDGLLCKLSHPCLLPPGVNPRAFNDLSHRDMEQALFQAARSQGLKKDQIERAMMSHRSQFERIIKSILHQDRPWFHGILTREEAQDRIYSSGVQDGKYLVRERNEPGSFALSVCFNGIVYHYKIDKDCTGQLFIKDGPKFDSLLQMVDHYTLKKDGLLCCLTVPCVDPHKRRNSANPVQTRTAGGRSPGRTVSMEPGGALPPGRPPPSPPGENPLMNKAEYYSKLPDEVPAIPLNPPPVIPPHRNGDLRHSIEHGNWEEPELPDPEASATPQSAQGPPVMDDKEYGMNDQEKIYDRVAKINTTKTLDRNYLILGDKLGKGNFGSVLKGMYKMNNESIPVAVKTLKADMNIPNSQVAGLLVKQSEIMKEAEIMAKLDHKHIVRLIGICQGSEMMLVLELAELGPLHKYLKTHKNMSVRNILELLSQVAQGMQYLESRQFVHRDLAARNVLLVSETFCKISDFGMSKALGLDSQYYVAPTAGKWPLKWYAPECICKFKFSSKSDVWSYGVTLWEATSYGLKPYSSMKGPELMDFIDRGERLSQPEMCPDDIYQLMKSCWRTEAKDRPSFHDIVKHMGEILQRLKSGTLKFR